MGGCAEGLLARTRNLSVYRGGAAMICMLIGWGQGWTVTCSHSVHSHIDVRVRTKLTSKVVRCNQGSIQQCKGKLDSKWQMVTTNPVHSVSKETV